MLLFEVTSAVSVRVDVVVDRSIVLIIDVSVDGDDELETVDWELDWNDASVDNKVLDENCVWVNSVLCVVVVDVVVVKISVIVIVVVVVVVVVGFVINLLVKYTDEQFFIEICFITQHLCFVDGLKFIWSLKLFNSNVLEMLIIFGAKEFCLKLMSKLLESSLNHWIPSGWFWIFLSTTISQLTVSSSSSINGTSVDR